METIAMFYIGLALIMMEPEEVEIDDSMVIDGEDEALPADEPDDFSDSGSELNR